MADPLSGVNSGQLEISRLGSGTWQTLPTRLEGPQLEARVDDAALPAGRYAVRAAAHDRAGNTAISTKRADGSAATVDLPLRLEARLSAGFVRTRTIRRIVKRRGKRVVRNRRKRVLAPEVRARLGRAVPLTGQLVTRDGRALAGGLVHVFSRTPDGAERYVGSAPTDAAGRYRYVVRATASQDLRLVYLGSNTTRPAIRAVRLVVPARTRFAASKRRLLNGQSVRFQGRLSVPPASLPNGKLVELQTKLSGRWQTFRTIRTYASGSWSSRYRFRRTRGVVKYRFRVRLPKEAGYPYGTGISKAVRVTVRGR